MKGAEGEGVKISEQEFPAVLGTEGVLRTPSFSRGSHTGCPGTRLPGLTVAEISLHLGCRTQLQGGGADFPCTFKTAPLPLQQKDVSLARAVGRTLAPLTGKGWKWICFFLLTANDHCMEDKRGLLQLKRNTC